MTIDLTTRNLLISLSSHMAYMQGQLEALHQLDDPDDHYWYRESVALRQKVADHLAALANEPAVPQGREPASVTGQPSDEELLKLAQQYSVVYLLSDGSACNPFQEGYDMRNDVLNFARAVLGRWGNPAPTPAAGEVAELVAEIRHFLAGYQQMRGLDPEHIYSIHRGDKMEAHITVSRLTRVAELLERLSPPQPVPVSERLPGPEDCDSHGWCWVLYSAHSTWTLEPPYGQDGMPTGWTHWLPAHALPLPEVGE